MLFIKSPPRESNTVVGIFFFYTGILCGARAENVIIEHLVNISYEDDRTALFDHLLRQLSHHDISCVCTSLFVPHVPSGVFCALCWTRRFY